MRLDLVTLCIVTVFVTGLVGALLLFSWWQNRAVRALAWWGAGMIVATVALVLLISRTVLPPWVAICVGNAVLCVSYGLLWGGFRVFEKKSAPVAAILAGALIWIAGCGVPELYKSFTARVLLASAIGAAYAFATAFEIRSARGERLGSRAPLAWLFAGYGLLVLARCPALLAFGPVSEVSVLSGPWVVTHVFAALMFSVTSGFLLLGMTKERIESEQRSIAARDPLTGILNRRAFLDDGRALLDRARGKGAPCALLLADLDRFKGINDTHGHAAGDDVLQGFSRVALAALPPGGLMARLGGEEFVCLLPGATDPEAGHVAERIRLTFEAQRFETEAAAFSATVSIGIATSGEAGHILDALLATADLSLYRAKREGRNRVARLVTPDVARRAPEPLRKLPYAA